jgi:hypothetical protein
MPEQPYIHMHVTILSTTAAHPNPEYFGMSPGSKVPRVMLTTKERPNSSERVEFSSLSYHGPIREGEWAVKIFSNQRLSDEWLDNMFQGQVKWVTRKEVSCQWTNPQHHELINDTPVGCISQASAYDEVPSRETRSWILLCQRL